MRWKVLVGDALEVLRGMEDAGVDSVVTDPPYGFRFMGKRWDYDLPSVELWREVLRVSKPGAHLLSFGGARTYHRAVCRIEDAGWEIRDCLMWIYGSGFPKSLDVAKAIDKAAGVEREDKYEGAFTRRAGPTGNKKCPACGKWLVSGNPCRCPRPQDEPVSEAAKEWDGWGTALKPAHEPIVLARKPLEGTVAANVLKFGTGGLNIDGCRIGYEATRNPATNPLYRKTAGYENKYHADARSSSFSLKDETGERNPNEKGRFPANVLHDGSGEVMELFPETKSGKPGIIRKGTNDGAAYGAESRPPGTRMTGIGDSGSAARFFYCAKASKADREEGMDGEEAFLAGEVTGGRKEGSAGLNSPRAEGAARTGGARNFHPTVKPTDLMRWLCRLVTPPGGVVLDLFAGSGSTGKAAALEGFGFIGIEIDPGYARIARRRIAAAAGPLFDAAV